MKNVTIDLTDEHAAALEAEVASGDYTSVSEVVRAALREFLDRDMTPSDEQMLSDYQAMRAEIAAGEGLLDAKDALTEVRRSLDE